MFSDTKPLIYYVNTIDLRSKTTDSLSGCNGLLSTTHKLPYETIDLANETIDLLSAFIGFICFC